MSRVRRKEVHAYDDEFRYLKYFRLDVFNVMDVRTILKCAIARYLDGENYQFSHSDIDSLFMFIQDSSKAFEHANKNSLCDVNP